MPERRRNTLRVSEEAAQRLLSGHPWVYRTALERDRTLSAGEIVEVMGPGGFLGRGLYDPNGAIAVRLLVGARESNCPIDGSLLRTRIVQALKLRQAWLPAELTAFRLIHSEGDGLSGVTCDRYGNFLVVSFTTAAWEPHESNLLDALEEIVRPDGIYLQRRYVPTSPDRPRAGAQHVRGQTAPIELEVVEAGLRFLVDVSAPLSPGLFADLREGRMLVRARSEGRRVLNVFSFTGAFTLHALAGGATEVTAIDLSARCHARARANLERNNLADRRCELLAGDALALMSRLRRQGRRYDLVVLDPPTFSAGKGQTFSVLQDYAELCSAALSVLQEGGVLAASANTHRLPLDDFERACAEGGARVGAHLRVVARAGLPPDFPILAAVPETNHLKFSLLSGR